ncbi:MAG: PorP/SprF family type IX secretion system membrane protein [Saprospiraceae bacterium]|nr:PorP/SprF family type IX secretion system membrane protein [Saprospiraceae bacterium]
MLTLRLLTLLLFCALTMNVLRGQDLHYSQFYHNPLHLSPALTGIFRGDLRAAASYRSQWKSVPVSYQTFAGTVDWKTLKRDANLLSVGLQIQHDGAGDAGLTWTQVGATASVAHALGERQALSAGVGLAVAQRSFDISKLTFKNQWAGDQFSSSLPTGEDFGKSSGFAPTLSAGLNWHYEPAQSRTRLDIGAGAFHLNAPKVNFRDDTDQRLPMRLALMFNGALQTGEFTDVVAFGATQQMGKAREILAGAGVRRAVSEDVAVQFTLGTRVGDAIIPAFQVDWLNWTAGLSYDLNISDFDVATRGRGGIEIAVVYRTLPVPPVKTFKSCPIF